MSDTISNFQLYSGELDAAQIEHKTNHQLAGLLAESTRGNQKAWHDLWLYGTKLVLKICNKLDSLNLLRCSYEDAVAEGNLAIGEALTRWNPKKASFGTWVWIRVRGAVLDASNRENPEAHLLSADVTVGDDQEHGDDEYNNSLYDLADPEYLGSDPAKDLERQQLRSAIYLLENRYKDVVLMVIDMDMTQAEIAGELGVSQQRVYQLYQEAQDYLKIILDIY